jgi:hypothetical protein
MIRAEDKLKFQKFINHLLSSSGIRNENLIVGESMIYAFVAQNREQLKLTFQGSSYFPHLSPEEAQKALLSELYEKVSGEILKPIYGFIDEANFDFLNSMPGSVKFPAGYQRDTLRTFITTLFRNRDARMNFMSIYNICQYGIIERYLAEIFKRRDYLYNELVRVQKTYLEVDAYITYMKLILLVKNSVYTKVPLSDSEPDRRYSLNDSIKMPGKLLQYFEMLERDLKIQLPVLNERTINFAVKSNLNESMTELEESSSRLVYILSARFHNYKPTAKIDRGAESPDKSWFAVAKKNAKLFGFDKKMLEELYRIAGDNNW